MKNTKKIISLVLAICMLASLAISASAANNPAVKHRVNIVRSAFKRCSF